MRAVLMVLVLALTIYSLLDCARTSEESMPARMPKFLWITLIVLIAPIGSIAWIIVSRVKAAEERGGAVEPTVWSSKDGISLHRPERSRPAAPDDDPEFLRRLERDIRRRRRAEDRDDADDGPAGGDGEPDADGKPRASDGDGSRS